MSESLMLAFVFGFMVNLWGQTLHIMPTNKLLSITLITIISMILYILLKREDENEKHATE